MSTKTRVEYLTTEQVAGALQVRGGARGVTRLIRQGSLKAIRLGREYRVPSDALDEYRRAHEVRT